MAEHRDMTLETIGQLKRIYGLELGAADSHSLAETGGEEDDEPS
ncbi:hypothetical protein [Mesorhizobium sp.]|nr:hypothetical protein [Mesorhizobium sp.]